MACPESHTEGLTPCLFAYTPLLIYNIQKAEELGDTGVRQLGQVPPQWSPQETLFPRGPHLAPRCQPAGEALVPARGSGSQFFESATPATPQIAERQKTHIPVSMRDGARPQTAAESEVLL